MEQFTSPKTGRLGQIWGRNLHPHRPRLKPTLWSFSYTEMWTRVKNGYDWRTDAHLTDCVSL